MEIEPKPSLESRTKLESFLKEHEGKVLFPEKLALANATIKRCGLPKLVELKNL